jgi:hypothetical protein
MDTGVTTFKLLEVEPALIVAVFCIGFVMLLGSWIPGVKILGTEIPIAGIAPARVRIAFATAGGLCILVVIFGYAPIWTPARLIALERQSLKQTSNDSLLVAYPTRCRIWADVYLDGTYKVSWLVFSSLKAKALAKVNGQVVSLDDSANYSFSSYDYERFVLFAENALGNCSSEVIVFKNQESETRYYADIESREH